MAQYLQGGGKIVAILVLIPLVAFKYYNFINDSMFDFLSIIHLRFRLPGLNWAIPVGISFFTFQALGYFLDVYHKRISAEKNLMDYLLFVSFFPQVASGPISKASELLPQIKKIKVFSYDKAVNGCRYFLWGLFLKIALADRADVYVAKVLGNYENFSGLNCLLASFMYSIQIYADFAGYSFMAIGVGKLLGFDLINNFNHPYFSMSVTDFWRRWHISLSRWLKDYVYIPLGGSRCSRLRNYVNILITFLVSGLWHGANWTFIIWGVFHGVCQVIEKMSGLPKIESKGFFRATRILVTFTIVSFAWIIFRSSSIGNAYNIVYSILTLYKNLTVSMAGSDVLAYFFVAFVPFIAFEVLHEFYSDLYKKLKKVFLIRWTAYIVIMSLILLIGVFDGSQFIYANF
ncbi:MBOAT family protein [Fibrobacter sp. UWB5]|uniref:MBOAT family O-acyltransferase n=1 Tax=Fibrobacter sp. UWB5 TaxID=1964360 RepID=UPI0018E97712|nr:MBOAT family O-acyltransferase [Fibrobacter sp. UWB5]